jgi:glutamate formiminotransferase/formiminotetrahydrofolate cyclodeaminase
MEVVDAIVQAIASVPGVAVLHRTSDADHNRSVVTFAGEPDAVCNAAFAGIAEAARLINLDEHQGQHPRLGAADVVPFVPLGDATLGDCVVLARRLGERVGRDLRLPVYLYEAAATRPEWLNLEDVRRGGYETLKTSIGTPERAPDYGPAEVGPAGAVIIGARRPLVAFNVFLTTDDVTIARKIAAAVRQSSGGLPYVKALGLLVDGHAQVSMNLTDTSKTPVHRVVELVRGEAARYGAAVHHSELIGLIPQSAVTDVAQWYLQLDDFGPERILETQLEKALSKTASSQENFLERLAAGSAAPAGGAAAAYSGAMAAALAGMAARLTLGKKKYADVEARMHEIAAEADQARERLQALIGEDEAAYTSVMDAYKLPKQTEDDQAARQQAVQAALRQAMMVQQQVGEWALRALRLLAEVAARGNANAVPDAAAGAAMARAAITAAALNVRANLAELTDINTPTVVKSLNEAKAEMDALDARIQEAIRTRTRIIP